MRPTRILEMPGLEFRNLASFPTLEVASVAIETGIEALLDRGPIGIGKPSDEAHVALRQCDEKWPEE